MTETPEPLPIESTHCRVRARVSNIYADGNDEGTGPDWRAPRGEAVTLIPGVAGELLAYDVNGPEPRVVMVEKVECVVGAGGWLKTKAEGADVYIVPTDDPLLSVTGWTWTATIRGKSIKFSAPMGGVVDLAMFVAAPATDDTKTWVERIPELVALFEAGTDPAEIAAAVEDYLAANPPVSDATAIAKGALRLAGDLGGTADAPTVPGLADKADADHDHTAADIDSGAALDGHVLTADGAGGAAWEPTAAPATHESLAIDGDTTLPSEHQVITLRVSSPATLSIADAPDGTVVTAHVVYGWEDITWAPEIVVQGETSTTETWLVLVRSEGEWKVLVSGESADSGDSGSGGSGGGSIAGLNVITGSWPPPLPDGDYPDGTLFVRGEQERSGPIMAVKKSFGGWTPLAADDALSSGFIDPSAFTSGVGEVSDVSWMFHEGLGNGRMVLVLSEVPENGDILCTFDSSTLTGAQRDCLDAASWAGLLTGTAGSMESDDLLGAHHLTIDSWDGVVKYLWPVGGAPLAVGDVLMITWPVIIESDDWESGGGGGIV